VEQLGRGIDDLGGSSANPRCVGHGHDSSAEPIRRLVGSSAGHAAVP
jgi:hypothetical protein